MRPMVKRHFDKMYESPEKLVKLMTQRGLQINDEAIDIRAMGFPVQWRTALAIDLLQYILHLSQLSAKDTGRTCL